MKTHLEIYVQVGWTRAGSDIRYYRNNMGSISGRTFYSLTWTIEFPHKDDTCYFAHCYPYTYTDLQVGAKTVVQQLNICD